MVFIKHMPNDNPGTYAKTAAAVGIISFSEGQHQENIPDTAHFGNIIEEFSEETFPMMALFGIAYLFSLLYS